MTIALETALTPELEAEGMARELVSKLQNLRKDMQLEVTDRVRVTYPGEGAAAAALAKFRDYIAGEVLAAEFAPGPGGTELDINGSAVRVDLVKAEG